MTFTFTIDGNPVPQPRPRVTRKGWAYTPDGPIHAFRAAIVDAVRKSGVTFTGPVALTVDAVFARPKSHYLKSGLKATAPMWPKPDGDNIAKGIADAIKDAGGYGNDSCVLEWHIYKRYGKQGERGSTTVSISEARLPCH